MLVILYDCVSATLSELKTETVHLKVEKSDYSNLCSYLADHISSLMMVTF